jgi:hypothetical protein
MPYIIILTTFSVAPPWPIIKREEHLQYTLQLPSTSKIFTEELSLVNTCLQKLTCHHYDHQLSLVIQCMVTANTTINQ